MSLSRVNGSRPMVLLELHRRRPWWRPLGVVLGLYCRRCGRWLRHSLLCPRAWP